MHNFVVYLLSAEMVLGELCYKRDYGALNNLVTLDSDVLLSIDSFLRCPARYWRDSLRLIVTITGHNSLCTPRKMSIPTLPGRNIL